MTAGFLPGFAVVEITGNGGPVVVLLKMATTLT